MSRMLSQAMDTRDKTDQLPDIETIAKNPPAKPAPHSSAFNFMPPQRSFQTKFPTMVPMSSTNKIDMLKLCQQVRVNSETDPRALNSYEIVLVRGFCRFFFFFFG